jgi:uncharacterized peroxidase-related enzyme
MTWTRSVRAAEAKAPLDAVYRRIGEASSRGTVANLWQSMGADPKALEAAFVLYRTLMSDPSPLSRAQAELIAVVVSATNGCGYCVARRGPHLAAALQSEDLARAVARDYREADLAARDRVLLDYAVALTCEPSERTAEDVERVREYGFDDDAIVKATEITAYYNFINRVASGLGVALDDGLEPWEFGAQK